jgi:hypothetical protein
MQRTRQRKSAQQHEERKVVTLYGERGWHDPDTVGGANQTSMVRGYGHLNEYINDYLAKRVTIHSVSYSNAIFPTLVNRHAEQVHQQWLFATVVYSGEIDFSDEIKDSGDESHPLVIRRYL